MENGNAKFRQYLLGKLTAKEAEEIDLQIIADESLEEDFYRAESDLMEDYLDEMLAPPEVELFEKNFLVSAERETHLKQIALLKNYARRAESKIISTGTSEDSSMNFLAALGKFFSPRLRIAAVALLLVMFGSAIGLILYNSADRPTNLEKEFAELNQKDLTNLTEYKNLANVNLVSGTYRDSSGTGKLSDSKLTDRVLFRLALPVAANSADRFNAQIIKDEKISFTQNNIRIYSNPNGQELRFFLPSAILKKGEYQIRIEREDAKQSPVLYSFAVQ